MFIMMKDFKSELDYDVLFVGDNWKVSRGFLYYQGGVLSCLVDGVIYEEGQILLIAPYTKSKFKNFLFNVFKVQV